MSIEIDMSEVRDLTTRLERIPATVLRGIRPVVSKGALNVKNEMQDDARESPYFGQIAPTISYDLVADESGVEAKIGPDKDRLKQANRRTGPAGISNVAYFGTSRGGGTIADPATALANEADRFEGALAALLDGVL